MKRVLLTLALATLVACGGDSTAPTPTVDGTWQGTVDTQVLTLTLVQTGATVSGSGTFTGTPTGTRALTVAGSFVHPTLSATLSSGSVQPIAIQATLGGGNLSGSLTGSGFTGEGITLTKR